MTQTLEQALDKVNNLTFQDLDYLVNNPDFSYSQEALEYMTQECEDDGPWLQAVLSMVDIWQEGYCIKNDIEHPRDINSDIYPIRFFAMLDIFSHYCQQVISECLHDEYGNNI
jgi:hypothetical protein